eukprot:47056_1
MSVNVNKAYLKSKIRVGSIHSKLNYDRLERVFHSDDIPQKIKDRVNAIHQMKQNHFSKSFWNKSTYLFKAEKQNTIPHKYTLNPSQLQPMLSETKTYTKNKYDLSKPKTLHKSFSLNDLHYNHIELQWGTTDFRDLHAYHQTCSAEGLNKWEDSTIIDKDALGLNIQNENTLYAKHSKQPNMKKYLNPIQREEQRTYLLRKYKDQNRKTYIQMLQEEKIEKRLSLFYKKTTMKLKPFTLENKENICSNIKKEIDTKYNNELLQKYLTAVDKENVRFRADYAINQRLIELMMNKRNKMYTTRQLLKMEERRKYDIIRDYFHNGIYQNKTGGWSCCMNSNKNSQGCQVKLINIAKWLINGV